MPIQINELILRTVVDNRERGSSSMSGREEAGERSSKTIDEILRILKNKNER